MVIITPLPQEVVLELELNRPSVVAGDVLEGVVRLSVSSALIQPHHVVLQLEGHEWVKTQTRHIDTANRCVRQSQDKLEELGKTLILDELEYPFPENKHHEIIQHAGSYQYPFCWRLPNSLPTTMFCLARDGASFCEVRYTLTARLVPVDPSHNEEEEDNRLVPQMHAVVYVSARPNAVKEPDPVVVHPQFHPLGCRYSCGLCSEGAIRLGWQTDRSCYSPSDYLHVLITLDKPTAVKVQHVLVLVLETVEWKTGTERRTETRSVAKLHVPTADWKHRDQDHKQHLVDLYQAMAVVRISETARDTYKSANVSVHHVVMVNVEPEPQGWWCNATTSPQSTCPIRIARGGADLKPMLLEEPDKDKESKEEESTEHKDSWQLLYERIHANPDQLPLYLEDARIVTLIQNVSPSDYSGLVVSAGPAVVTTARLLAVTMGPRFTCHHLLAAVHSLPKPSQQRVEILQQTALLVSDLEEHREWLEEQLQPNEVIHLRAALKA